MAHKKNTTNLTELLLQCVTQPDPMLSMLEWLCTELMEAEVDHSWAQRRASARTEEAATAAVIVLAVWIPGWARCTSLDARKISSSNMIERLNREIRRRTGVIGIFPNESSYVRLVTTYLMEYAEDWSVSRAYLSQESIAATLLVAA